MVYSDNSDTKHFIFGHIISTLIINEIIGTLEISDKTWYLDSRTSRYFFKNRALFKDP